VCITASEAPRPGEKPPFAGDATPIAALTTMKVDMWRALLSKGGSNSFRARHPDTTDTILDGIVNGVTIDFEGDRSKERFGPNLPIDPAFIAKVEAVIEADVMAGKKAGPFDTAPFPVMAISPVGAVPKKDPGKVRVIHHLSYPFHGDSVNESIVDEKMSIQNFGHAARAVVRYGRGAMLIKLDVEAAYKQVPVRRDDWPLLGFKWKGKWYYERVLPFGLKSSCRLWDMYASALHDLFQRALNVSSDRIVVHYVDDFLFVVKCEQDGVELREAALSLCVLLGIPMAGDKTEGPVSWLTFLGIELDCLRQEARLPAAKLLELRQLIDVWVGKTHATVKELQSLVGILNFACSVVRPGRHYLRRIISHMCHVDAFASSRHASHQLTKAVMTDVRWWQEFLPHWNGVSLLYELNWTAATKLELTTDACDTGFGARFGTHWSCGAWSPEQLAAANRRKRISMPFLELHALVYAAEAWGAQWGGRKVIFHCDCMPVVQAITKQSSRREETMHLLRILCSAACRFGFDYRCVHIPGVNNTIADVLSRYGDCVQFRALCPDADLLPTLLPFVPLPPPQQHDPVWDLQL
jgi:hypothetical protein